MAEKIAKTPKTVADVQAQAASVLESVRDFATKMEVPEAAREAFAKTAQTLKDKAVEAQATLNTATNSYEKIAGKLLDSQLAATRSFITAAFDNFNAVLAHAEKVAAVKTPVDAVQLNAAFAQSFAQSNYDRVLAAAEAFKTEAADNAKLVQNEVAKLAPALKVAA